MRERAWALGFLLASGAYLAGSLAFPVGTVARPGPGFFPVGVGVFLCLAATALLVALARRPRPVAGPGLAPDARARVTSTVLALAAFCLLLPWVGYPVCAFGFVAVLLRRLGALRWTAAVGLGVVSALGSYWAFGVLLGVPLPRGPF